MLLYVFGQQEQATLVAMSHIGLADMLLSSIISSITTNGCIKICTVMKYNYLDRLEIRCALMEMGAMNWIFVNKMYSFSCKKTDFDEIFFQHILPIAISKDRSIGKIYQNETFNLKYFIQISHLS